jgi:chromate transporter
MVAALAWGYVRFHALPGFQSALYGIKPVVVAIIAQAIVLLVGKVVDTWPKRIALSASFALALVGVNQLLLLLGSGLALGGRALRRERSWKSALPVVTLLTCVALVAAVPLTWEALAGASAHASPLAVFLYFIKLGSVLYGGGYVMLSFLETDLVLRWAWLTKPQLLDAIAVGQFTPGPVFTTATFIGYILAGPWGALAGTVGIFLPAFVFIAISGKLLHTLRGTPVSGSFLDGVNAAALALMGSVLIRLGKEAIVDLRAAVIALAALILVVRFKWNSALLIALGAIAGLIPMHLRA